MRRTLQKTHLNHDHFARSNQVSVRQLVGHWEHTRAITSLSVSTTSAHSLSQCGTSSCKSRCIVAASLQCCRCLLVDATRLPHKRLDSIGHYRSAFIIRCAWCTNSVLGALVLHSISSLRALHRCSRGQDRILNQLLQHCASVDLLMQLD